MGTIGIAILIEGGCLQAVWCSDPGQPIDVELLDRDNLKADTDEVREAGEKRLDEIDAKWNPVF